MRVIVAEDSLLVREGLSGLLREAGFEVVGAAGNADEVVRLADDLRPDVAVLDIRMPPTHTDEGLRAASVIRSRHPDMGILVLSQYVDTGYADTLISEGARGAGYLLKDRVSHVDQLTCAVRGVAAGECVMDPQVVARLMERPHGPSRLDNLSAKEREVLELMAEGRSNGAIAATLAVSERTVETHVSSIFTELDLMPSTDDHRRVLAVLRYLRSLAPRPSD